MLENALFTIGLMTLVALSFEPVTALQVNLSTDGGEDKLGGASSAVC